MVDVVDKATRSRMMAGIRGKDTQPELFVRSLMHRAGFRYRLHEKKLPGKPDIVLPRYRSVIFIHGCFWHRHLNCKFAYLPKSRRDFWISKLEGNAARDKRNVIALRRLGWRVFTVWECRLSARKIIALMKRIRG